LKSAPALKVTTFIAGILIFCDGFCGLTPVLAFLLEALKVPNPCNLTSPSFFTPAITVSMKQLTSSEASFLETHRSSAKLAISIVFVIFVLFNLIKRSTFVVLTNIIVLISAISIDF
jgi:hypothetical protein